MSPKLLLILAAPALIAAADPPPPAGSDARARFQGLFVDWSSANRHSIEAERRGQSPQAVEAAATGTPAGSRALGERVGEVVATGDCAEGERLARAAGDFALVAAVREHCAVRPSTPR